MGRCRVGTAVHPSIAGTLGKRPDVRTRPSAEMGPIPLAWMKAAAMLPGKSLHAGLALWYLVGLKKTRTVALGNRLLKSFGVDRKAKGRCLKLMEGAGLITVESRAGCNPTVTLLDAPEAARQETFFMAAFPTSKAQS